MSWRGRPAIAAALLLAALAIAGCGLGPGEDVGSVELSVTREFGAEQVLEDSVEANESDTVMRVLEGSASIETRYGAQQCRLAAAGAANDGNDLAGLDFARETLQRVNTVGVSLAERIERKHQMGPPWGVKASCQRSHGAVAVSSSQSVVLPRMAKITIAATIWVGLPSCWPSMRR